MSRACCSAVPVRTNNNATRFQYKAINNIDRSVIFPYSTIRHTRRDIWVVNERNSQLLNLTADIVTAHVANNSVAATDVPLVIQTVHAALAALGTEQVADVVAPEPAVPVRTSLKPDYIVCLEDRSERRVGKGCVSTCRSRWSPDH